MKRIFQSDIRKLHFIISLLALGTFFFVAETLILGNEFRKSMVNDVLDQFYKQQINVARQTAAGVEKFLEDIMSDLELLAQYPQLEKGGQDEIEHILKQFYSKNHQDVVHFYFLDKKGIMRSIYPHSSAQGEDFSYRTYFQETRQTFKPYVSRFLRVRENYGTIVLAYPVLARNTGSDQRQFVGVVAATVSVNKIKKRFIEPITVAETGYAWVIDSQGTVIIHPIYPENEGKNVEVVVGKRGMAKMQKLLSQMRKGKVDISQYTYNGVTKYAAFCPFSLGDQLCSVAVCAPVDEVKQFMQSTMSQERILLIFVIFAMLGAGGTVIYLVRRIYIMRMEERSRDYLMEIFQSMHDGVCILSPDYTLETLNPALADSLGVDESWPIGKKCYSVFMDRDHRCDDCPVQETWGLGAPSNDTKFLTPPSKEGFSTEMYTLPLTGNSDSRPHVFCYMKDLSKEMRLKDKLTQSKKLATVGQMAAGIAHEIRNPLVSIRSSIEMLKEHTCFDKDERTLAEIIYTEAVQLEQVIREFLVYAQPPQLERTRVQLNEVIQDVFREIERRNDFVHVDFEQNLAFNLPEGYLDRRQISQILWNLLQNAADAIQDKGTIRVCTYWRTSGNGFRRKSLFLIVEDNGQGFDESMREKIFKPFFTTKGEGLGMGLALVLQSIEAQDGEIHVESQIGKGTRFSIRFPLIS